MIKKNNYNILFCLKIFKNILTTFLETFLILYFFQVSNSNILPIGIYKLLSIITIWLVIFSVRNICKNKQRINLLRIGIILNFLYFFTLIVLKEKVIDYIYLVGILYGLEEGFYYSVYNMIESDGITNNMRQKYVGSTHAVNNILSILLPIFFGYIVLKSGFINSLIIFIILIIIQIILSYLYDDVNLPKHNRVNLTIFKNICHHDKKFPLIFKMKCCEGIVYSEGALKMIISLFIIRVFSDSFSLGIFTSIFSIISALLGWLFIKTIKTKNYKNWIIYSTILTVITLIWVILNCNPLSIIIFNFFQRISKDIINLINEKNIQNIANVPKIKNEYKVEYYLFIETALVIGRIIGSILFILMAFIYNNIILYIFIIFLIMWSYYCLKIQIELD